MKLLTRVEIEWTDSHRLDVGWMKVEEYQAETPVACRSVGWLVHETPDAVTLALSAILPEDNGRDRTDACDAMVIPRVAIRAIHELRRR